MVLSAFAKPRMSCTGVTDKCNNDKKKRHVYSVYCNTSGHHKLTVPLFFRRKTYQSKALISQIVAAVCGFVVVYLSFNMCFKGLKTFNT